MRHLVKGRKLGRTASHRKATLRSLAIALVYERRIETTVAKAKELRGFIEPLITRAKTDTTHNRRQVFSRIQDKYAVTELFEDIGPAAMDRPGGYTRVIRTGFRKGDAAEKALIELVDFNDVKPDKKEEKKKRTRRAGKSNTPTQADADSSVTSKESKEDEKSEKTVAADVTDEQQGSTEDSKAVETDSEKSASSTDFNVDEVKEKLKDMSVEEAEAFTSGDERVTVQRAVDGMKKG